MPEPLVTLEGVSKEYRTGASPVHALRDVSLSLPPGVLCVVHGRSGSGKTTLLNMIGGLDRPSAGRVVVDGREVSSLGEEQLVEYRRDTVGFVFQAFGLIPILTAAENVEVPLRLRRAEPATRDARVHELLHLVDLGDRAHHRRPSCPAASSSASRSRARSATSLASSSPTNRPASSTRIGRRW